jgi:hypothetical protein
MPNAFSAVAFAQAFASMCLCGQGACEHRALLEEGIGLRLIGGGVDVRGADLLGVR